MSEVSRISKAGQPRVSVQLTPGPREMSGGGGHSGNTGASKEGTGSLVGSVSSVKHICHNFVIFASPFFSLFNDFTITFFAKVKLNKIAHKWININSNIFGDLLCTEC